MKQINWSKLLKVLIAILTAIAGSLGVVSCMNSYEYRSGGVKTIPSTDAADKLLSLLLSEAKNSYTPSLPKIKKLCIAKSSPECCEALASRGCRSC